MITLYVLAALALIGGGGLLRTFKVVTEYERGVKFTLGKFAGVMEPGLRTVVPLIQSWERVDMRVKAEPSTCRDRRASPATTSPFRSTP
jgi:regulator of protease activity HflC (stomatin/prohibitin superfamily)